MKVRSIVLLVFGMAVLTCVGLLVSANCEPLPYCQYETCLDFGSSCHGPEIYPCSIGFVKPCEHQYYCPSVGEVWTWDGYTCCGDCY